MVTWWRTDIDIKQNKAPKAELRAASALKWPSEGLLGTVRLHLESVNKMNVI